MPRTIRPVATPGASVDEAVSDAVSVRTAAMRRGRPAATRRTMSAPHARAARPAIPVRRPPARRPPERPVGRRQDRRGQAVRGPRLHRRRQPAGRAPARAGRARRRRPGAVRARSRSCSTSAPATPRWRSAAMRGALEGRGIRPQVFFLEARDEVLIRRFSETRHRHPLADQRGIASSIAEERRAARPGPERGRRRHRHERPAAARAARADLHPPRRGGRPGSALDPADQLRLQVRRPARGRPRLRRPVHAEPVLHRRAPPAVGPRPRRSARSSSASRWRSEFLAYLHDFLDVRPPGLRRRGQDAADDRHRLHRRLPPLDRARRGARRLAARAGLRPGRRLPPRARPDVTEPDAARRCRAAAAPPATGCGARRRRPSAPRPRVEASARA